MIKQMYNESHNDGWRSCWHKFHMILVQFVLTGHTLFIDFCSICLFDQYSLTENAKLLLMLLKPSDDYTDLIPKYFVRQKGKGLFERPTATALSRYISYFQPRK